MKIRPHGLSVIFGKTKGNRQNNGLIKLPLEGGGVIVDFRSFNLNLNSRNITFNIFECVITNFVLIKAAETFRKNMGEGRNTFMEGAR